MGKGLYIQLGSLQEQKILLRMGKFHHGVILKALLVKNYPAALYSFLQRDAKNFFIDPQTFVYALDHENIYDDEDEGYRQGYYDLAEVYSSLFFDCLNKNKQINLSLIKGDELKGIVKNVIDYQKNCFLDVVEDDYFNALLKEMAKVKIEFYIAPYFFLAGQNYEELLGINVQFATEAKKIENNLAVFVPLGQEILDDKQKSKLVLSEYKKLAVSNYVIWVDNLDDLKITEKKLSNLLLIFEGLSQVGNVINYYGGYLSTLLTKKWLSGYGFGPGYSESRGYLPIKGMTPTPMFYFLPAHRRYKVDELLEFFENIDKDQLLKMTDNSPVCRSLLKTNDKPQKAILEFAEIEKQVRYKMRDRSGNIVERVKPIYKTRSHSIAKHHFLFSKYKEYEFVQNSSFGKIEEKMKSDKKILQKYSFPHMKDIDRWLELLEMVK